ncbi:MAG: MOSC N-terminal beta barrel domain-containing protein [Chryseolinea sp.]
MRELKLTQIWIYPIKSLGGIALSHSRVMKKGLELDRRWMLVDQDGVFITQRVHTILALFKLSIEPDHLVVNYNGDTIFVPLNRRGEHAPVQVQIWDDNVTACEVDERFSIWFSERLGIICRLVQFPEENPRQIDPEYSRPGEYVSLADSFPFLIVGDASLHNLNTRLDNPISMKRFRPNLVFSGGEPFEEDTWKEFTIGESSFQGVKPSSRCVLTTVDPETGNKGAEPLKTLAKFRRWNNKIYFGQNVVACNLTTISVGDKIMVHSSLEPNERLLALAPRT